MANTQGGQGLPMPVYETTFITRNDMTDEALKGLQERVRGIITSFGGEVVKFEDWGKRKLAYAIEKETRGHYSHFAYTGKAGVVAELERNLRLNEFIMRFLTVNISDEFNAETYSKGEYTMNRNVKANRDAFDRKKTTTTGASA